MPEVTQSEEGQKQKLRIVLHTATRVLGPHGDYYKWSVQSIHSKNLVAILHLLVALARHYRAPVRLPENVIVNVVVVQVCFNFANLWVFFLIFLLETKWEFKP